MVTKEGKILNILLLVLIKYHHDNPRLAKLAADALSKITVEHYLYLYDQSELHPTTVIRIFIEFSLIFIYRDEFLIMIHSEH